MESAAQPLSMASVEILVQVLKMAYTQLAEVPVPVLVRAHDAVNILQGRIAGRSQAFSSRAGPFRASEADVLAGLGSCSPWYWKGYRLSLL